MQFSTELLALKGWQKCEPIKGFHNMDARKSLSVIREKTGFSQLISGKNTDEQFLPPSRFQKGIV